MCDHYLINFHKTDIIKILQDEDIIKHFSININFIVLYEHQPATIVELLRAPEKCLDEWDRATLKAQMALLREAGDDAQLKNNVHCRIYHLPDLSEVRRTIFPGNDDAGKFLQVSGTVMRISAAKLLEYQRNYICVKCKYSMLVKAEYERKYILKRPKKCENPEECSSTNLVAVGGLDSDNCKDYQEIKIQEQVKKLGVGCMPNTMWVTLEDDLVDCCKPGDNVTICGIVKRRWGEFSIGCKIDIDLVLKANNVQVDNNCNSTAASTPEVKQMFSTFWEKYSQNSLAGRDLILRSFCPQLYGLYLVKLAIAVVLAGGSRVQDTTSTGVRTRSESHLLLVGDPGTGKSQLLRFASKIIPRSVLTTGVGSTAAGLTVTAMMEHGEWQLEGGALVMSDGGICCIDEFNSMKEHDRTSIHEAMEQQTISVAKASIVCKLNTRCSVLAACNPKGNLDISQPLIMSIALPSPLLSRFDLILLLRDVVNEEWDSQVADYILNGGNNFSKLTDSGLWSIDILQSYFAIIKKLNPKLSENAEKILSAYYQMQRRIDSRNKARTTVRLLESLIRLSQGHTRLMYHEKVETLDSIYAIVLVDAAMEDDSSILDLNICTHSVFLESPLRDYRHILEDILKKLGLLQILNEEIATLNDYREAEIAENVKSRFFNMRHRSGEDEVPDNFKENIIEHDNRMDVSERIEDQALSCDQIIVESSSFGNNTKKDCKKREERPKNNNCANKKKRTVDVDLNVDLAENENEVPISSSNVTKNMNLSEAERNVTKKAKNCKDFLKSEKNCKSDNKKIATRTITVKKFRKPLDIEDDLDLNFDKDDTLSFDSCKSNKSKKFLKKDDVRSKNISSSNVSRLVDQQISDKTSDCNSNLSAEFNIDSHTIVNENVDVSTSKLPENENLEIPKVIEGEVKKAGIRDKLKKFKFVFKDNPNNGKISEEVNNEAKSSTDIYEQNDKISNENQGRKKLRKTKETCQNSYGDFINEDLKMLKFMPSVNDDLNIDLNIDWDNLDNIEQKSKVEGKKMFMRKKSESATFSSISENSISSHSSKKMMFQTSDENIDDLDLDI